ncbi:serine/threonine protein kinase with PASTA sensor(s) [Candidatus Magnetobacterium bavaricum]|uniref:non-specific serine/threonine protein kinase n=1 Tax=Candidatus Magnetobacterium bavaricum TaxID=29290 RepID=A0A0F3H082_9BACT|nr:serine/threonine protein kinase with PASTA sensor(s) [Candidatus Magnetobacterium bavaricum]
MEIKIEVFKGPDKGKVFVVSGPKSCFGGRRADAEIRFTENDAYISRNHFMLELSPPNVYFRDLDVTNPSKINGQYAVEAQLQDGDVLEVGFTRMKVMIQVEKYQPETFKCKKCGKDIEIYADETPNDNCFDCLKEIRHEQLNHQKKDKTPLQLNCYKCGKDISKQANSDGRAEELIGKVIYSCSSKKCLPETDRDSGKMINDYEVIRKLGEGGMGKVYLVYHKSTARLVALKELNISSRSDREVRISDSLNHENVLYFIDTGIEKKTKKPYITMEIAAKGSLEDLITENKRPLPPCKAVDLIIQALRGLAYLHRADSHKESIIHRDIKPENILLRGGSNGELIPKISDFGLAKEFKKLGGSCLTRLKSAMGTILFMSPEQAECASTVKEPADIYSLGATLYYLLTWRYVFDFPTQQDVIEFLEKNGDRVSNSDDALRLMMKENKYMDPLVIVKDCEPIPIRKRNPDIPIKLASIVDKSIKKSINQRYQSADDFRNELESIVDAL